MKLDPAVKQWLLTKSDDRLDDGRAQEVIVETIEDAATFEDAVDALDIPDDLIVWLEDLSHG